MNLKDANNKALTQRYKNKHYRKQYKISPLKSNSIHFFPKKQSNDEILVSVKVKLDILLSIIKNTQLSLITSQKSVNDNNKYENQTKKYMTKNILHDLNKNLTEMYNAKKLNLSILKNKYRNNKSNIQSKTNKYKKCKNSDINQDDLDLLKLSNFRIENEIKKYDFLIKEKKKNLDYLKVTCFFAEENRMIMVNPLLDYGITQILNDNITELKTKLSENIIAIKNQKNIISYIENEIGKYEVYESKNKNQYVHTTKIIKEEYENSFSSSISDNGKKSNKLSDNIINSNVESKNNDEKIQFKIDNNHENAINYMNNILSDKSKSFDLNHLKELLKYGMNINVNINVTKPIIYNNNLHIKNINNILNNFVYFKGKKSNFEDKNKKDTKISKNKKISHSCEKE